MAQIEQVIGREIIDSRGNPTVEVWMQLSDGTESVAAVPSGASTGKFEAHELRDGDEKRFGGAGVEKAVTFVNTEIRDAVRGMDALGQSELDARLKELDGTENKSRIGANAILGVSLASARAAAISAKKPLYRHIADLIGNTNVSLGSFPVPMFNVVNGGKHSDSGLSVQEFKLVPSGISTYPEQFRAGCEIFHALKKNLEGRNCAVGVGDEGGFAPHLESHTQALEIITESIERAGYAPGKDVFIGLDVAANSFYEENEKQYHLLPENVVLSKESIVNLYREWMQKFALVSIEDGLEEEDWEGWRMMKEKIEKESAAWGKPAMLIGDDLLVTNVTRLKKAIDEQACNSVLIKPNQIGTLSETLACIALAKEHSMNTVVSHRSGETIDTFIADLAVGTSSPFIKTGSLSRGERIAKYNRLLEIYRELSAV